MISSPIPSPGRSVMVCVLAVAGDTAPAVLATGVPADAIGKRMVDRRPIGDAGQGTHMGRRAAVAGREPATKGDAAPTVAAAAETKATIGEWCTQQKK